MAYTQSALEADVLQYFDENLGLIQSHFSQIAGDPTADYILGLTSVDNLDEPGLRRVLRLSDGNCVG